MYYALEPFGSGVDDALNAYLIACMANLQRDSKQTPNPYQLDYFLLFSDKKESKPILHDDPEVQSTSMMQGLFEGLFNSQKG